MTVQTSNITILLTHYHTNKLTFSYSSGSTLVPLLLHGRRH